MSSPVLIPLNLKLMDFVNRYMLTYMFSTQIQCLIFRPNSGYETSWASGGVCKDTRRITLLHTCTVWCTMYQWCSRNMAICASFRVKVRKHCICTCAYYNNICEKTRHAQLFLQAFLLPMVIILHIFTAMARYTLVLRLYAPIWTYLATESWQLRALLASRTSSCQSTESVARGC